VGRRGRKEERKEGVTVPLEVEVEAEVEAYREKGWWKRRRDGSDETIAGARRRGNGIVLAVMVGLLWLRCW
jgi:hypothetical protein